MSCEEMRRRIQEALDGAASSAELESHLLLCEECRTASEGLREVDLLLREEADLEWDPALTVEVLRKLGRERWTNRWRAAAAAVLLFASGWLGFEALSRVPIVSSLGTVIAEEVPLPRSPGDFLSGVIGGIEALGDATLSIVKSSPISPGIPLTVAAILGLLVLNGLLIGRPRAARRRQS